MNDAESRAAKAQAVDDVFEKLKSFQVDHRKIVFLEDDDLQEGGFGVVRPAHLYGSAYLPSRLAMGIYGPPQLVAVKQMKISKMFTALRKKRPLAREMLVWATLPDHPGIAKFLGFYADFNGSEAWLLSPWEPNGNVSQFIKSHNVSAPEKLSLIYDTIDALAFLHQMNPPVCHGDIKAGNVLVTSEYRARLCDFGLAQLHGDNGFQALETSTGQKSSIRWSSPELVNQGLRSPASDVYAWAWLVWEIMTGETPRKEARTEGAVMLEITNNPVPQLDGAFRLRDHPTLWDLMVGCWNVDPPQRPTARVCKFTVSYLPRSAVSVHGSKKSELQNPNNAQDEKSATERNLLSHILPSHTSQSQATSSGEHVDDATAGAQAVDEEYEKLQRFHVEPRRIVFTDDHDRYEGGFGIVRKAKLHHSAYLPTWLASRRDGPPQLVAVKQIKISQVSKALRVKRAFTREILVWASLPEHPGIIKFLGFHADFKRSEAWLISPWEPNGDVREFVNAHNLEVPEKLSLVYDTIDALTFLHELDPPVCHGNIHSPDVLITAGYKARLCDFGLAVLHEDTGFERLDTSGEFRGSLRWCSPELFNGERRSPMSDMYAWAWLVWEIMTGELPYEGIVAEYAIIRKIFEGLLPKVDGESRLRDCLPVWELMKGCWNVEPGQRPTARMCKTTVAYLPRFTPAPANADHQSRSAVLLANLGDLESWKGNPGESSAFFDEALRLCQKQVGAWDIAFALRKQALATYRFSDYVKLRAIATTVLKECRSIKDALGIAEASFYLGYSAHILEKSEEALSLLLESLEIRRSHGDDVGVVQCLEGIADVQRSKGHRQEALSILNEAVQLASRSGDRLGLANAHHTVGLVHFEMSDFVKASGALQEAITIARDVGWEGALIFTLQSMGSLTVRLGDLHQAEDHFQESISIARRMRNRWGIARGLEKLGGCLQTQSMIDEAASAFEEAFSLWDGLSNQTGSRRVASILVELKRLQNDWERALLKPQLRLVGRMGRLGAGSGRS